jgi:glycerol-3-phosphate acyltransferase PlsY
MHNVAFQISAVLLLSYALGSIPFGLLLTKMAGLGDIRKIGSGNIGATNVLRTGRKGLAALTLLLDGLKGAAAVLLARHVLPDMEQAAGLAALFGHLFPVWLRFKGGKGVATAVGVITALAWPVGVICMAMWVAVAKLSRFSSLAALVAIGLAPGIAMMLGRVEYIWVLVVILLLVFWRHSANIQRLANGTESRIGESKHAASPTE